MLNATLHEFKRLFENKRLHEYGKELAQSAGFLVLLCILTSHSGCLDIISYS